MIVGIDLGTTNSAVAVWRDGRAELIPNALGHVLTPSAVSLDADQADRILVGLAARERRSTHPQLTATAFKRYMGSARTTTLGTRAFTPEELSSLVLKSLKADAEAYLGEPVREAVITVPAYFNDKQRKATRRAGELAGLKVERLLNEPTAAALAYGIDQLSNESRFLVFDLGGGTFDVSILEIFEGVVEVRSSTGDNRLGGEDFNEVLVEGFLNKLPSEQRPRERDDPQLRERLREAAERAKRGLSERSQTEMSLVWKDQALVQTLSADEFETWSAPLLARLREPVLRALRDSGLRTEELSEIVMVGGATRMPLVRRAVTKMFGRFPANAVNPDEAVAIGAAVQAGLKARDAALNEMVLTDVCPYSLGVDVVERGPGGAIRTGLFSPIIERNTVIPASRMQVYSSLQDNQTQVKFDIYQGESRRVADNVKLGALSVKLPPAPAGHAQVEVRFTYDINGLLEVETHVPQTGERRELVITDGDSLTPQQVEAQRRALAGLKQHPRDGEANRQALARAGRCYEMFLGERREWIAGWITEFELALDTQDPRTVEHARKTLTERLDQLEGETWL